MAIRNRTLLRLLLALIGFAVCVPGAAADPTTSVVHLIDGRTVTGSVTSIDHDALSITSDSQPANIPLDDVLVLDLPDLTESSTARSWLLLSSGDRAPLTPVDLVDDAFICHWGDDTQRSNWRVPLDQVSGLLRQPLNLNGKESLLSELSHRAFHEDTLILSDGTRLAGALEGLTPDSFRVETAVGVVNVEATRVEAMAMNAALVQRPVPPDRTALLTLRDGAWLTLHDFALSPRGTVTGRTTFDAEFQSPLADVVRIAFYGPRSIDLTQRQPQEVSSVPFVSQQLPLLVNRNVRGGWLTLAGRHYARGFGMTSGTTATFDLLPEDRQFQATVGLDDCVGDAGSVVFAVDVDGRRLFTSPIVRGHDDPLLVGPLDIAGGKRLSLCVEFADFGNVQDVANWCNPAILR